MVGIHYYGFDVGGQSVKGAMVSGEAEVLANARRSTGNETTLESLASAIADLLDEFGAKARPAALGIGLPGVIGPDGILAGSPNMPSLLGRAIERDLSDALGTRVRVENDANCAALAEGWHGAAEGRGDYLAITLGTGLGSGLVVDGNLYNGETGFACELGHTVIERGGRVCGCGNRGCLEAYASESGLRGILEERGGELSRAVADRVAAGEGYAQALFSIADGRVDAGAGVLDAASAETDSMIDALGIGLASAINLLDVQTVVIGGGIAPHVTDRIEQLRGAMAKSLFARSIDAVDVLPARHGNDAGAIGAASLVR